MGAVWATLETQIGVMEGQGKDWGYKGPDAVPDYQRNDSNPQIKQTDIDSLFVYTVTLLFDVGGLC